MSAPIEFWTQAVPDIATASDRARRAEQTGWDGITFTDSQNLIADPFVVIARAADATERLRFATGVTNAATRHPAALATVAATVHETSGGRFVLGIGRGDTALFHLGRPPQKVTEFAAAVDQLQTYLSGGSVDCDGHDSRLRWLRTATQPKVPVDIASSGPKVIAYAASTAERISFAVGADPERLRWAIDLARTSAADAGRDPDELSLGAYLNVGCHPDPVTAREMIAGSVAAFAHFSSMPGSTGAGLNESDRAVVAEVGRAYDSNQHLRNDATHTSVLDADFVDRFAVTGDAERVVERLRGLADLGLERFIISGPGFGSDRDAARLHVSLLTTEVIPALRADPGPAGR